MSQIDKPGDEVPWFTLIYLIKNARDWYLFHLLYNSKIFEKRFGNKRNQRDIFMKYLAECMNVKQVPGTCFMCRIA